jgi:hypothetical protein
MAEEAQVQEDPYLAMTHNQPSVKVGQAESIRRVYREWNVQQYSTGNRFNSWKDQMGVLFEDAGLWTWWMKFTQFHRSRKKRACRSEPEICRS